MSFTTEEGIMNMMEELMVEVFVSVLPNVAPPTRPFPVISYRQAMNEVNYFNNNTIILDFSFYYLLVLIQA